MHRKQQVPVRYFYQLTDEDVIYILEKYGYDTDKDISDLWIDLFDAVNNGDIPESVL